MLCIFKDSSEIIIMNSQVAYHTIGLCPPDPVPRGESMSSQESTTVPGGLLLVEVLFVDYKTSVRKSAPAPSPSQESAPSVVYLAQYGELLALATFSQTEALDLHSAYF